MPRGNDQDAALHELADRFGQGVGNAELLIDASLAANTMALRKAQILPRDEELTEKALRELRENPEKYKGPEGERVVGIAVRGSAESPERYTVVVVRDDENRDHVYALDGDGEPITPEYERRGGVAGRSAHNIDDDEAAKRRVKAQEASKSDSDDASAQARRSRTQSQPAA